MRILSLTSDFSKRHNWGHQHFRDEIARQHDVFYVSPDYLLPYGKFVFADRAVADFGPFDFVLTVSARFTRDWLRGMEKVKIPKVHIALDYVSAQPFEAFYDGFLDRDRYDLLFARTLYELERLKSRRAEPVYYLPYAVNEKIYSDTGLKRDIDVSGVWSQGRGYPYRAEVKGTLRSLGRGPNACRVYYHKCQHEEYVDVLRRSKIFIGSVNKFKTLTMKVTEAMACGCLYLTDEPLDLGAQGFVNGKHLVLYDGMEDLASKIRYYLRHEQERMNIAKEGRRFVLERHNNAIRVGQFTKKVTTFLEEA